MNFKKNQLSSDYERYGNIHALDFNDKNQYKHAFDNNKFDIVLKQYYNQCINGNGREPMEDPFTIDDVWCYCDNGIHMRLNVQKLTL